MKKVFFILCIIFSCKIFAVDAGYAYRFYINVETNQGEQYAGYTYFYYEYKYDEHKENILSYLTKKPNKELLIYPNVISVNAKRDNVDFTLMGTQIKIDFSKIVEIKLVDALRFKVGNRIKELTKAEFQLIKTTQAKFKVIEDINLYENIKFILFTWDENKELSKIKAEIAKEIKKQWKRFIDTESVQSEKFNTFMKTLKENLLTKNILLIEFAEAL